MMGIGESPNFFLNNIGLYMKAFSINYKSVFKQYKILIIFSKKF